MKRTAAPKRRLVASPRLFDFQINGFAGVDFQSDDVTLDHLRHAVAALRARGVVKIFATFITDKIERLCRRLERFEKFRAQDTAIADCIAGYHLEGPWLSPKPGFCGAHRAAWMRAPARADFVRLQTAANGRVRLVTLAPEWPRSAEFIAMLAATRVHVSLGHTDATEVQIDDAIAAGARFATHLGNGTPLALPRHDNIIQRLLARDELIACFIPDGVHLPPFVLRNFVRAKPSGRVLFTTDAMAGAGAPPGRYSLGHAQIEIGTDRIARNPGGGFAGSTLTPDEGVRRVADYLDVPLATARVWWSEAPAKAFGVKLPTSLKT